MFPSDAPRSSSATRKPPCQDRQEGHEHRVVQLVASEDPSERPDRPGEQDSGPRITTTTRSITFKRTNAGPLGDGYRRTRYSTAKTAQMN